MKNKKKVCIVVFCLLMLVFSFVGGSTYAKYMSRVDLSGRGDVAQWSFKVNQSSEIQQTINLSSGKDDAGVFGNKIAPGTYGNFDILIDATGSEVGLEYHVNFANEQNKPTNLKYVYNGEEYNTISEISSLLDGTINANDPEKIKTFTIGWKWDFETGFSQEDIDLNNSIDTTDSKNLNDLTFDINVTANQVL